MRGSCYDIAVLSKLKSTDGLHHWSTTTAFLKPTLESGINVGVRLSIFELFFRGYVLIKVGLRLLIFGFFWFFLYFFYFGDV
jgi:hypothetical protein